MSAADTVRETLIALANTPSEYGKREIALAALDELEAELARANTLADTAASFLKTAEAELERLTVGRATLEDQTSRAELAEARVAALEAVLREGAWLYHPAKNIGFALSTWQERARAVLVLSGGSE